VLNGFQQAITKAVAAAVQAVAQRNQRSAQVVIGMKEEINSIADSAAAHEARRLIAAELCPGSAALEKINAALR
jgi:phosphate:Na+ symporter